MILFPSRVEAALKTSTGSSLVAESDENGTRYLGYVSGSPHLWGTCVVRPVAPGWGLGRKVDDLAV
jgi:hypothetical protein